MRKKLMQAYGPLQKIAQDLWVMDGEWNGTVFGRRMTICRLSDGTLAIHNAFCLSEEDLNLIKGLGDVRWILVPNKFHFSEAYFFQENFPQAKVMASKWARKNLLASGVKDALWLPQCWEGILARELPVFFLKGMRGLGEFVFVHRASRTLIVTDLVFHMTHARNSLERSFLRLNGIFKVFGPSRIAKLLFTKNEKELGESLQEILAEDFDRVIMNHGEILHSGGKMAIRDSFSKRFPKVRAMFGAH